MHIMMCSIGRAFLSPKTFDNPQVPNKCSSLMREGRSEQNDDGQLGGVRKDWESLTDPPKERTSGLAGYPAE